MAAIRLLLVVPPVAVVGPQAVVLGPLETKGEWSLPEHARSISYVAVMVVEVVAYVILRSRIMGGVPIESGSPNQAAGLRASGLGQGRPGGSR